MADSADDYEHLGPLMRARLDAAETSMHKTRRWAWLLAERGPDGYLLARELCLALGMTDPPAPRQAGDHDA